MGVLVQLSQPKQPAKDATTESARKSNKRRGEKVLLLSNQLMAIIPIQQLQREPSSHTRKIYLACVRKGKNKIKNKCGVFIIKSGYHSLKKREERERTRSVIFRT